MIAPFPTPSTPNFDSSSLRQFWQDARRHLPPNALPEAFVLACSESLQSQQWEEVGRAFRNQTFFGKDGHFILCGHYRTSRAGIEEILPLGIAGQALPAPDYQYLSDVARDWLGSLAENVLPIRPVRIIRATGKAGRENGEAFIVPDGWSFTESAEGPALNDMDEQRRRFETGAKPCLRRIFEPASAQLLIGALENSSPDWLLQYQEFQYHEVGHATGLGLRRKLREGLLATPWYRGVEEWRADGIAFELLARTLSPIEAGKTIAANFVLRFGVDAQRGGGMERDTDVSATLLSFESLFASGYLKIGVERKLEFTHVSYEGLLQATEKMRYDALRVTREEMGLAFPQGIWGLYGSLQVSPGTRRLFQGMVVDPCAGIFSTLR